ncbi:Cation/H+ exchanger [Kalmanozyma brasiliensis GHG001]|uniref:Cation/H+ exchanger transmembrane domain-containing protein n=1 Tax=Kalmanozyma brasiliensis (strain GHG001) TaxID=1365824 RepID=V5GFJ9_KALBG|nr:Cation/H+ exchanger [Kalmanozyma brasiliensis GHG001]EST04807.1 Cation/H+ exchanger [Kalmanozyma brasiliensis GHG001]
MGLELEVTSLNLLCTAFGLFFIPYGTFSYLIKERLFLGEAPLAVLIGIGLGPYGLSGIFNWTSPEMEIDEISLGLCRVVIGIQLTLVGVQLPYKYPWIELRSLAVLLLPVMTTMWLSTTLCIWLVVPSLPLLAGLAIATSATPTDPVLSNAIVKGAFADQYISPRIRNLLSAESGANDGFGYPFLFLAVHLIKRGTTSEALTQWLLGTCLYTVGGSVIYGIVVGYLCRKLIEFSTDRNLIDKESFLLFGAAMGVFIIGSGGVFQIDDLLAAFVAGNALSWTDFYREQCEESEVDNCLDLLLNLIFFSFLGATIPWDAFNDPDNGITPGKLVLMCILVLLFRRLPAMLAFYRYVPTLHDVSEACFIGYFAPIGAGALFYLGVIMDEFEPSDPSPTAQRIRVLAKPITYALILSSIIGHSLAIPFVKIAFQYFGVESIKLAGESEADEDDYKEQDDGSDAEGDGDDDESRPNGREEVLAESDYEQGEHPRHSRRSSRAETSSQAESYRHSSVHAPESRRRSGHREEPDVSGAYHCDGSWDDSASWRVSSGHKLGPHHQLRRNEQTGQLELDPLMYTLEHGAPVRVRRGGGAGRSLSRTRPRRSSTAGAEDTQALLEEGRRGLNGQSASYGSTSTNPR